MDLEILRGGQWNVSFNDYIKTVEFPLKWQIETMGGHNRNKYQIISDTYPKDVIISGRSSGGQRTYDSIVIMAKRDLTIDDFIKYNIHTIVHEFFHTFDWKYPGIGILKAQLFSDNSY